MRWSRSPVQSDQARTDRDVLFRLAMELWEKENEKHLPTDFHNLCFIVLAAVTVEKLIKEGGLTLFLPQVYFIKGTLHVS